MTSRRNQYASDQAEATGLEMGREQRHQSFAHAIADKYRFVRRDDRGRLSLTFREKGAAAAALPPASITTVVQQVQLKLGLLMPLQVQLDSMERRWLVQVERWLRGTDRSFDRVVKRVGQRLRENERQLPGVTLTAKSAPAPGQPSSSPRETRIIQTTRTVPGTAAQPKSLSDPNRGRSPDTPFIHADRRVHPEERAEDRRMNRSEEAAQEDRKQTERVEDLLERMRVEWRRAMRQAEMLTPGAMPGSAAGNRQKNAARTEGRIDRQSARHSGAEAERAEVGERNGASADEHKVKRDLAGERSVRVSDIAVDRADAAVGRQSHATLVMDRYMRMLGGNAAISSESGQDRGPALIRSQGAAGAALDLNGDETGAAKFSRGRIVPRAKIVQRSAAVHESRNEVAVGVPSAIGSANERDARQASRGTSGHTNWSAKLVHAVLGRLGGERSVTIRPFLNRTLDTPRTFAHVGDPSRIVTSERSNVRLQEAAENRGSTIAARAATAPSSPALTTAARSVIGSADSGSHQAVADDKSLPRSQSAAASESIASLSQSARTETGAASSMAKGALQLRLRRRPVQAPQESFTNTSIAVNRVERPRGNNANRDEVNRPGTLPGSRDARAAHDMAPSEVTPAAAADSPNGPTDDIGAKRERPTAPLLRRGLIGGFPALASASQSEGSKMLQAFRQRNTEGRRALSRWQLVEIDDAGVDQYGEKPGNYAYRPVRNTLLVQRTRHRNEPRSSNGEVYRGEISHSTAHSAKNSDIRITVKPATSTQTAIRGESPTLSSPVPAVRSWMTTAPLAQIQRFKHRLRSSARVRDAAGTANLEARAMPNLSLQNFRALGRPGDGSSVARRAVDPIHSTSGPLSENIMNRLDGRGFDGSHGAGIGATDGKRKLHMLSANPSISLILARKKTNPAGTTAASESRPSRSTSNRETGSEAAKRVIVQRSSPRMDVPVNNATMQQTSVQSTRRMDGSASDNEAAVHRVRGAVGPAGTASGANASGASAASTPIQQSGNSKIGNDVDATSIAVRAYLNAGRLQSQLHTLSAVIAEGALNRIGFVGNKSIWSHASTNPDTILTLRGEHADVVHVTARRAPVQAEKLRQEPSTRSVNVSSVRNMTIQLRRQRSNQAEFASSPNAASALISDETISVSVGERGEDRSGMPTKSARVETSAAPSTRRSAQQTKGLASASARHAVQANLSFVYATASRNLARLRIGSTAGRFAGRQEGSPLSARQTLKQRGQASVVRGMNERGLPGQRRVNRAQSAANDGIGFANAVHRKGRHAGAMPIAGPNGAESATSTSIDTSSESASRLNPLGANGLPSDAMRNAASGIASIDYTRASGLNHRLLPETSLNTARGNVLNNSRRASGLNHRQTAAERAHGSSLSRARGRLTSRIVINRPQVSEGTVRKRGGEGGQRVNRRLTLANLTHAVQLRNKGYAQAGRLEPTSAAQSVNAQAGAPLSGQGADRQSVTTPAMHYAAARAPIPAAPTRSALQPAMMQHASKTQAAPVQQVQPPNPVEPPKATTIDPALLQQMLNQLPQLQPDVIAGKVMTAIEKKMKFQQRTRGY